MPAYIRFLKSGMPIPGAVRNGLHAGWSELLGFSMGARASVSRPGIGLLRSLDGGRTSASAPELQEVTITKLVDASSPVLMQQSPGGFRTPAPSSRAVGGSNVYGGLTSVQDGIIAFGHYRRVPIDFCKTDKSGGSASQSDNLVAEVNFTAAGSRAAELRVMIHDIRVVRYQRHGAANGPVFKTTNFLTADSRPTGARGMTPIDRIVIACSRMTHAGAPASAPDISQDVRGRLLLGSDQGVWRQAGIGPQGRLYLGTDTGVF